MDPVIYYRLARPCQAIEKLPALDLDKLFDKEAEPEQDAGAQISITIKQAEISQKELDAV